MKKNLLVAVLFTLVTTVMFGLIYPLVVTGLAQLLFPGKANGQLIQKNGKIVGSSIIGQAFTGPGYFHSRPSAAGTGNGYDPTSSGGSQLGPTNKMLIDRVNGSVKTLQPENPSMPIPVDLATTSGSGLDPDISPQYADIQVNRVAAARHLPSSQVQALVNKYTQGDTLGFLGEPRVDVLTLNIALNQLSAKSGS